MFIGSKSLCPILPELHPITPQSQSQSRRSNHTSASGEHMLLPIVGTIAGGEILQTQHHLLQREAGKKKQDFDSTFITK